MDEMRNIVHNTVVLSAVRTPALIQFDYIMGLEGLSPQHLQGAWGVFYHNRSIGQFVSDGKLPQAPWGEDRGNGFNK